MSVSVYDDVRIDKRKIKVGRFAEILLKMNYIDDSLDDSYNPAEFDCPNGCLLKFYREKKRYVGKVEIVGSSGGVRETESDLLKRIKGLSLG